VTSNEPTFDAVHAAITADNDLPRFTPNLILVVGVGRSGTTALKHSLGSHPQVLDTFHEAPLQRAIASSYGRHLVGTPDFKEFVRRATVASWENVETSFQRLILEVSLGDHAGVEQLRAEHAGGTDLANLHMWTAKIGGLRKPAAAGFAGLFDGLRPVYIHRNGLETVQSRTRFGGFAEATFVDNCEKWAAGLRSLRALKSETDVIVVRHEDLLHRPAELFTRVLGDLGLIHDNGPADYATTTAAHPTQTVEEGESIAEHFESRPEAYLEWDDEQKRTFIDICGKSMAEFGYDIPFA